MMAYEAAWYRDQEDAAGPAERIGESFKIHEGDILQVPAGFEFAWLAVVDIDGRVALHLILGELDGQRLSWQWSYAAHFVYLGPRAPERYAWTSL